MYFFTFNREKTLMNLFSVAQVIAIYNISLNFSEENAIVGPYNNS